MSETFKNHPTLGQFCEPLYTYTHPTRHSTHRRQPPTQTPTSIPPEKHQGRETKKNGSLCYRFFLFLGTFFPNTCFYPTEHTYEQSYVCSTDFIFILCFLGSLNALPHSTMTNLHLTPQS